MSGYNSFYGGRRGASFVIVKKYSSIKEMVNEFQKGGDYKTVNYDEYVLIDTVSKNDADNGKIYRRGYEYTNDLGGAVYVGQIVGPAGFSPHVELKTINDVKQIQERDNFTYRRGEGSYKPTVNLLPGKYLDTDGFYRFNDEIQWAYCSVRDENEKDTTVHVGFKFPYSVIEYTAQTVDPYYHRSSETENFVNEDLVERTDDGAHPFFEEWHISIPKGIKGDAFKNFRVTTVKAESNLQSYSGIDDDRATAADKKRQILVYDYYHYDKDGGGEPISLYLGDYNMIDNFQINDEGTITIDYSHDNRDIYPNLLKWIKSISLNEDTGLFEIIYNYNKDPKTGENTKYSINLTWIKDIEILDDGTVKWSYTTSEDDYQKDNFIKWITNVSYNPDTGLFGIDFNYDTDSEGNPTHWETNLRYVKDVEVQDDGTIKFIYTYGDSSQGTEKTYENLLKYINEVKLNGTTGHFEVIYNYDTEEDGTPTKYETDLRWVDNISISDNGTVTIGYTTGNDVVLDNKIKWIKQSSLATDGTLTFTYNDDTTDTYNKQIKWINSITFDDEGTFTIKYNNGTPDLIKQIKWIKSIKINTGDTEGEGNQKLNITYNDNNNEDIGNPINYIMKTVIENGHLLCLYSDPARRQAIITAKQNYTYDGRNDWHDLGLIISNEGILVGKNYNLQDYPQLATVSATISYLNTQYPNGLTGENLSGKIVTVGSHDDDKKFYAFDYTKTNNTYNGWFYLGQLSNVAATSVVGKEGDTSIQSALDALPTNGLWFVLEE